MDAFLKLLLIALVAGFAQIASSTVTLENCPGNIYSKTGEASFTLPTAKADPGVDVTKLECDHAHEPTFYTEYVTKVICTAEDAEGGKASCEFNIYSPDGAGCPKRQDATNDKCVCSPLRAFFDPCECVGNYSGLTCQVLNADKCTGTSDPPSCDCSSSPCNCKDGFKGETCEIDFQAPMITCPQDIFTREESVQLPPKDNLIVSDNDGDEPSVKCSPELGTFVNSTGNTIRSVTCSARDTVGNRADCSFKVVIDVEPPRIPYCPGIIHTNNSQHEWPVDIAVDNSHQKLNVTCEPKSGDPLTDYITNVTCYVQDMAGNAAEKNCTFKIYLDGGTCSNSDANCDCNSGCFCKDGFSGLTCEVEDGSDCASSSETGPGCVCDGGCTCRDGYKGANCDIDYQPPELSNCPFGEIWSQIPVVTYRPMWTKDNNDTNAPTTVTCYPEEGSEFYDYRTDVTCSAEDESGNKESDCQFPVRRNSASECESDGNNCYNCQSRCRCMPGYRGPKCQVCADCDNGGYRENPEDCQCQCKGLYHGLDCAECYEPNADHCLNGGTFVMDTCSCDCAGNWTGRHCDQMPGDECLSVPPADRVGCLCSNSICTCEPAYTGPKCDTCKPCQNGGNNQDSSTCICTCPGYFIQPLCLDCDTSVVCQNGGTLDENTCTCQCVDGWKGKDCSEAATFGDKCPSDIIMQPDAGQTTAKVTWKDPTETDASVECQPASGSQFQDGTTNVVCTATYTGGTTSSCFFKVIIDGRAPFVNCPADMEPYHQRWKDTAVISWASVTAEDEVSGTLPATCIPPSGTVFGSSTVVCTASDQAGNLGFCTFDVTVYLRGSTTRFPTSMSCRKCYNGNPYGRCTYQEDDDEYVCYCSSGYTKDADGICQDIDECEENETCDSNAKCVNTIGGYRCECNDGFYGSGTSCREFPYETYPDLPEPQANEPPFEKIISIDVSIASESMFGCDMTNDPTSSECKILHTVFTQNLREKYLEFSPALLRIELPQSNTRKGNFGHTVVYDYSRLSASQKATSAQDFYGETIASSVEDGELGGLKLVKDCTECAPPKDLTNLCGNNIAKPECGDGYFLKKVESADKTSCYYACDSLCTTDYCSAGTCVHNPPFEAICRCPDNTFGPNCEPITVTTDKDDGGGGGGGDKKDKLDLPLILGCSIGGGVLLILILVIIGYLIYTKNNAKVKKSYVENGKANEAFSMEKTHQVEEQ
ncbi:neurogenic locus notch homolog protein 1-like [Patiria miniata]|uniref:Uncharacterized protein n=1 Tax=Patiria miniata TaxID=46514 RepID=A0A913ZDJ6_PATMI|nr:neurogenic locus notch homolog protein 1-like [Patiria miniata]